jgi:hypothetical protein
MSAFRSIGCICLAGAMLGLNCSKEAPSVAGIEITNGNCVGTIYNADGTVAPGASVRLFPRDYNPLSSADSVDSTVTDKNGRFSFSVGRLSTYNLIAQKASASCMDSVALIPNATIIVNDTLQKSGFISGIVRLQTPDTAHSIVILVMGTNVYAMPSDTSGKFTTPLLAAGFQKLRIFSTQSGYAVFDTVVTVDHAAETNIPAIFLPSANAPSVGGFSVALDSLTMYATFAWSAVNADSVVSYSLHRSSKKGNDSLIVVDRSLTGTIDDVVAFEGDTLTYRVAANGRNFKEGFPSKPLTVVPRQKIRWNKRMITKWEPERSGILCWLFFDYAGNMFMWGDTTIQKLDTNGAVVKHYENGRLNSYSHGQKPQADESGNIFIYGINGEIFRLDADLNLRKEFIPSGTNAPSGYEVLAATKDGKLLAICDSVGEWSEGETRDAFLRRVKVYNSNFVKQDEYTTATNSQIGDIDRFGDTFVATQWQFRYQVQLSIGWYDQTLHQVASVENFDYVNIFLPPQRCLPDLFFPGPDGLIFVTANFIDDAYQGLTMVSVSKADKKLTARFVVPSLFGPDRTYFFDYRGNFYIVREESADGKNVEVIYRYSLAPLSGAGTR